MLAKTEEKRSAIFSPDTKEIFAVLESLDEHSIILAKTYVTALADRNNIEKENQKARRYRYPMT